MHSTYCSSFCEVQERHKTPYPGFVYVLINPALPNLVKIGKTQGTAEERARQLSGTGIPASFVVVYEKGFSDCNSAESYVHTLLEAQGYRVATNREFFNAPVPIAIEAVLSAYTHFSIKAAPVNGTEETLAYLLNEEPLGFTNKQTWEAIINAAENSRYGLGDEIQNELLAIQLYEQAAKLGAPDSFVALSELYGYGVNGRRDRSKALHWLNEGTRHGVTLCWAALADAYSGIGWSDLNQPENVRKCLRKFFRNINILELDDDRQREIFFRLRDYVALAARARDLESPEDLKVIIAAGNELSSVTAFVKNDLDRATRLKSIEGLLEWANRAAAPPRASFIPCGGTAIPTPISTTMRRRSWLLGNWGRKR
jgi:hypothetical protein